MVTEITFWEYALFGVTLAYLVSVLLIRMGRSWCRGDRRQCKRRVHVQAVAIERRQSSYDRRIVLDRRA